MPEYDVTVRRREFREHTFRVTADTYSVARVEALRAAAVFDFGDSPVFNADEAVTGVKQLPAPALLCRSCGSVKDSVRERDVGQVGISQILRICDECYARWRGQALRE